MTASQSNEILKRLDRIEKDLTEIKIDLAESRGALRLAKTVIGILGLTGVGSILAWMQGQGK
tara:strand:- start:6788 stop:6973 length:186 start_codon:yes stop_codon:yes gene_type:complete